MTELAPTTASPTVDARLSRACAFAFCEGQSILKRHHVYQDRWCLAPAPGCRLGLPLGPDSTTFEEAWAFAEQVERDFGFLLPAVVVVRRCWEAVRAAGWRVQAPDDDRYTELVYRPSPDKSTWWVTIACGDGWTPEDLRAMATDAVARCRHFGIPVDVVTPEPVKAS